MYLCTQAPEHLGLAHLWFTVQATRKCDTLKFHGESQVQSSARHRCLKTTKDSEWPLCGEPHFPWKCPRTTAMEVPEDKSQ